MAGRNNNKVDNRAKLDKIYEIFDRHKVDIDRDAIWEVQGTPVIKHKDVERLGAAMGIKYDKPQILRAESYEAVIIVFGSVGDKMEWSIGEAKIMEMVDTGKNNQWGKPVRVPKEGTFGNYVVTGNQAAYPYAMAEKRAKDRVILKLADLHGDAYSSEEADDFKSPANADKPSSNNDNSRRDADEPAQETKALTAEEAKDIVDGWLDKIDACKSTKDVMELASDAQFKADLKALHPDDEAYLKDEANKKSKYLMKNKDNKADAA